MRWIEAALAGAVFACAALSCAAAQNLPSRPVPAPPQPVQPRFVVVLDAAHGGSDGGAQLTKRLQEKNLTLRLAADLKSALHNEALSITVIMTRESDADLTALNRAQIANHAEAAACLLIHATATGSGVHLFTSSLAHVARTPILPWSTAQAAYVTQSLKLESELDEAFSHDAIPVTMSRASVQPMDNLSCPAVAVEMAPLAPGNTTGGVPIADAGYEHKVVEAIAAGISAWSKDWKQ